MAQSGQPVEDQPVEEQPIEGQPVEGQFVITVRGVAGPAVRTIFADLQVTTLDETTVLAGVLPDQAALHGVLHRIEDLGLEVIDVRRQP